jgi:hypothetical protein
MENTKTLLFRSSFTALLLASCFSKAVSQAIKATLFFPDSTFHTVELDERAFILMNTLKILGTGEVVPLMDVIKVQANDRVYEPKAVGLYRFFQRMDIRTLDVQQVDTILLLQKVRGGTLSLYVFIDRMERSHWFVEKSKRIQELIQVEYREDGKLGKQDRYKGVMNLFTGDCPAMGKDDIEKLLFGQHSFEKVVDKYNQACGITGYEAPMRKWNLDVGLMAGYYHHSSVFKPMGLFLAGVTGSEFESDSDNAFQIGIFAKFPLSKRNNGPSVVFNVNYSSALSLRYNNENITYFNDTVLTRFVIEATFINYEFGVRYDFLIDNSPFSPFVEGGAGFRNTWKIKQNVFERDTYRRPYTERHYQSIAVLEKDMPKNSIFFRLRAGVDYKRFSLGVSYEFGPGGLTSVKKLEKHHSVGLDFRFAVF